jgi:hypothetical protein
MWFFQKI